MNNATKPLRRPKGSTTIPFSFMDIDEGSSHIVLGGSVNGHACRIILDTGASRTVADAAFIQAAFPEMALEANDQPSAGLGTNTMESHFIMVDEITVGEKILPGQLIAVLDLSHVNQTYEALGMPAVQLILGNDILKKHKAIIDYYGRQLILG